VPEVRTNSAAIVKALEQVAKGMNTASKKGLEKPRSQVIAIMRARAVAAAGSDRILSRHRSKAQLDAEYVVKSYGRLVNRAYLNAKGPWGIRDNSYVGGKTVAHIIRKKNAPNLVFWWAKKDVLFVGPVVRHPGSKRSPFWQLGVNQASREVVKGMEKEVRTQFLAAIGTIPWQARR
jgi:hypothetical protein